MKKAILLTILLGLLMTGCRMVDDSTYYPNGQVRSCHSERTLLGTFNLDFSDCFSHYPAWYWHTCPPRPAP